jgi:voltage-gated potassium channel
VSGDRSAVGVAADIWRPRRITAEALDGEVGWGRVVGRRHGLVEGFSPLQALYQTVSTVGLREVRPLDTSGQLFTIVLIFVGVGAAPVTLEGLFAQLVEAQTDRFGKRRTERRMADLRHHVVVCGYGRIGAKVAALLGAERQVLVVEQDADRAAQAAEAGYLVVHADATEDETLGRTAIERASVLVAALPIDADNLFVVLSGRGANPSLRIVARAQSVRSDAKLLMAGADRVVNPEDIGTRRLAAFAPTADRVGIPRRCGALLTGRVPPGGDRRSARLSTRWPTDPRRPGP